jgi:subtilisin family serine protease
VSAFISGRRRVSTAATAAVVLLAAGLAGQSAAAPADGFVTSVKPSASGVYLVELDAEPVTEYDGGVPGLAATRVLPGRKLERTAGTVRAYVRHLAGERDKVLSAVDGERKLYDYDYTFAGFSARLSADEAARLAATDGVKSVVPSELVRVDTVDTPRFMGLAGPNGAWEKVGGIDKAGDGVIIGVVDSGFVPERPSFAPIETTRKSDALVAKKWKGVCQAGTSGPPVTCNNKVIGARYFDAAVGNQPVPQEYRSPRDYGGHGTHTASTAAGNHGVTMTVQGRVYGTGSGIAPHARLAIYKVLWAVDQSGGGTGETADIVAGIDAAVADGVDVINYSISGSGSTLADPIGLAFLRAARAGVFVAVSAGNTGPGASTVGKNYPWVTTVANGTHDRDVQTTVVLGNGKSYTGAGIGSGTPSAPLVLGADAAVAGADPNQARICAPNTLDPAKATGKIVVCDRGGTDRVDKSLQVKNAGGIGMVMVNPTANTLNADLHSVPSVHLDHVAAPEVKAYAATAGATATIQRAEAVRVNAPQVASTSSRGPALAAGGDLLKPDVMAPGTNVIAATTALSAAGGEYAFFSGTSMASPHVAGMAAVIRGKNPTWSPMAVKSAILTTATDKDAAGNPIKNDSGTAGNPFGYGNGLFRGRQALDPGLVYDSAYTDWTRFVCGSGQVADTHALCVNGKADPSDLNYPTIAVGDLAGRQVVRRTVVNVGKRVELYVPEIEGLPGIKATVSPRLLVAVPGVPVSYTVTFEHESAPLNQFAFGKLHWRSGKHTVSSAIAIRPLTVKAPPEVHGTGTSGSLQVPLTSGFSGTLQTTVAGLTAATVDKATLKPGGVAFPAGAPAANAHVAKFTVSIPAGTKHARFATFAADYPADTDIDIHVYPAGSTTRIGSSAGSSAEEAVNLTNQSGSFDVYVDLFSGADPQEVSLFRWAVGSAAGNLTATPASQAVTVAGPASVTASWSGLTAGQRYLGRLLYSDGSTGTGATVIRVDG